MRIGFTIIYNGAHHLEHNDWGNQLAKMLDYWVIVEGVALPGGSTNWCNKLEETESNDGTIKKIKDMEMTWSNVRIVDIPFNGWISKDAMVNTALIDDRMTTRAIIAKQANRLFLWQLDCDEQWTADQMAEAERMLVEADADCGCFHANHYVGKDLIAKGTWGEGNDPTDPLKNAYRRLWRWKGQNFKTHEPPVLEGGNGKEILLPQRFNHYSYYFEKDVIFKSQYYNGYENIHTKWLSLQKETNFPQPINRLIGGYWGNTDTKIVKI